MMDHVEQMKDGIAKIKDGFAQLNVGPASFTLDCLLAAYTTLTTEYTPFKIGQRVELASAPHLVESSGWWSKRHCLVPGNHATVQHVSCDSDGRLRFDVVFDRETWIDREGQEQPVIQKHHFCFVANELTAVEEMVRR